MTSQWVRNAIALRGRVGAATCLVLALNGCSLDKVSVPDISGPSELGTAVTLTASPDVLVSDGHSTAAIQATVRDQNGQFVQGRQIFFTITSSNGVFAAIGALDKTTAFTGTNGIAQVIYRSPFRTDATVNQTVIVAARPVGTDANGEIYRTVRLELRNAEPPLFPGGGAPVLCTFVWEPPVGPEGGAYKVNEQILFQSTAVTSPPDAIARYFWDFGDGSRPDDQDKPQANHAYALPGNYTVTHSCTSRLGSLGFATQDFTIVP